MKRLLVLLVLGALVLAPAGGTCAVIYVPSEQPTIQAGVNAAAVGDTVIVAPGIYSESVLLYGGPMTLRSQGGPTMTIIDALAFPSWPSTFRSKTSMRRRSSLSGPAA